MMKTIYVIWFLISCSDAIGAAVCAAFITRKFDGRFGKYMTIVLATVAVEAASAGVSLLLWWPTEAADNPAFAMVRVSARSIKAAGMWLLALYLMGVLNGVHQTNDPAS